MQSACLPLLHLGTSCWQTSLTSWTCRSFPLWWIFHSALCLQPASSPNAGCLHPLLAVGSCTPVPSSGTPLCQTICVISRVLTPLQNTQEFQTTQNSSHNPCDSDNAFILPAAQKIQIIVSESRLTRRRAAGVSLQNLIGVDCNSLKSFFQSDTVLKKNPLLNICSLNNNAPYINKVVISEHCIDFLCLTETWRHPNDYLSLNQPSNLSSLPCYFTCW